MARKPKKADPAVTAAARMLGRLGGQARAKTRPREELQAMARKGGRARAKALTAEEKRTIASRAARARWDRRRPGRDAGG
jgi:general stress protein YciG